MKQLASKIPQFFVFWQQKTRNLLIVHRFIIGWHWEFLLQAQVSLLDKYHNWVKHGLCDQDGKLQRQHLSVTQKWGIKDPFCLASMF